MKIAMVIEHFDLVKGGQERSTLEMAENLSARGHDVTIITSQIKNIPDHQTVRFVKLKVPRLIRSLRLLWFQNRAEKYLRSNQAFDIIHAITPIRSAHVYQPRGGLIQETFQRSQSQRTGFSKFLRTLLGPNPRQRILRRTENFLAKKTKCAFLANSDYVRKQCKQHLNLTDDRIKIVFNGVDFGRLNTSINHEDRKRIRTSMNISDDQVIGLFLANNFRLKGLDVIIDAMTIIASTVPDLADYFKFLICGMQPAKKYFNRVKKLGLEKYFYFHGPTHHPADLFAVSDFLVYPTFYDPCSRTVLEAVAMGLPAITTKYNGAGEILNAYDCGFVLNNADPAELADRCIDMLDSAKRKQFSENTKLARKKISMEQHITDLLQFYEWFNNSN